MDGLSVEITMTSSAASDAQVFWTTTSQPGFSESKSARFPVEADGPQVYTVTIPPQDSPLTGLRIDPLSAEGDVRIDSIRVLR